MGLNESPGQTLFWDLKVPIPEIVPEPTQRQPGDTYLNPAGLHLRSHWTLDEVRVYNGKGDNNSCFITSIKGLFQLLSHMFILMSW